MSNGLRKRAYRGRLAQSWWSRVFASVWDALATKAWRTNRRWQPRRLVTRETRREIAEHQPPRGAMNRRRWQKAIQRAYFARRPRHEKRAVKKAETIDAYFEREAARIARVSRG